MPPYVRSRNTGPPPPGRRAIPPSTLEAYKLACHNLGLSRLDLSSGRRSTPAAADAKAVLVQHFLSPPYSLTQHDLAHLTGLSQQSVWYLNKRRGERLHHLRTLIPPPPPRSRSSE